MMRNTLRAVATDAWIFFTLPGCPAATNMAAYCGAERQDDRGRAGGMLCTCGSVAAATRHAAQRLGVRYQARSGRLRTCTAASSLSRPSDLSRKPLSACKGSRWRRRQRVTAWSPACADCHAGCRRGSAGRPITV